MAITNAQQYQQLVNKPGNGKRPGYRGDDAARSERAAEKAGYGGTSRANPDTRGSGPSGTDDRSTPTQTARTYEQTGRYNPELEDLLPGDTPVEGVDIPFTKRERITNKNRNLFINNPAKYSKYTPASLQFLGNLNRQPNRKFFYERVLKNNAQGLNYTQLEQAYEDYMTKRMSGETDAMGNINPSFGRDDGPDPISFIPTDNNEDSTEPEDPTQLLTSRIMGSQFDPTFFANEGGRAALAEGGMPYEGGIMDLESGRQQYFLGKLVKKATRAVKKIAKSPIGKAAILGGLAYFGGGGGLPKFLSGKGLGGFSTKTLFSKANPLLFTDGKFSMGKLGLLSAATPFLFPEEKGDGFDIDAYYAANQLTPGTTKRQMGSEFDFYKYNLAEGGMPSKEPVAKKTMPLIDMDGQEMDLRAEGGFVPIGRMERADDVPARLSKNEFVFTADAVRNAGEGDIDKGAEVMYNMMKNLESGGEVSEESQGLNGARGMFQTSKRLEEVL